MQSGSNRNSCERHSHHVPCFHDVAAWFMELRAACSQMAFNEPGRLSESRPSCATASGAAQLSWLCAAPPLSRLGDDLRPGRRPVGVALVRPCATGVGC